MIPSSQGGTCLASARDEHQEVFHLQQAQPPHVGSPGVGGKKWNQALPGAGAYSKPIDPRKEQAKSLSAQAARASRGLERVPYLNPDAFSRFIGSKNWGKALINDELTTCLLDNSAQLNFVTPVYAIERGMDIMSLDRLAQEIGGLPPPQSRYGRQPGGAYWVRTNEREGALHSGVR